MSCRTSIVLLLLLATGLQAQDIHFSQYDENPLLINPALAGALYPLRASVSYKNQWRSVTTPYKTMGISFDSHIGRSKRARAGKVGFSHRIKTPILAAGIGLYRDVSGDGRLNALNLNLSLACKVPTGKRSFLSLGVQGAYIQKSFDQNNFVFPNQFNGMVYDPTMGHNEQIISQQYRYGDAAAGILWYYGQDEKLFVTHREFRVIIGASVYNVPERAPDFLQGSLLGTERRYVTHTRVIYGLKNARLIVSPSLLAQMQLNHLEIISGCMLHYTTGNSTRYTGYMKRSSLGFGLYYRHLDAVVISSLIEVQELYAIGINYDMNISGLRGVSRMFGGLELNLRFSPTRGFLYQGR